MQKNLFLILLALSVTASSCFLRKKKTKDATTLRFLKMEEYCGGAAPPPDMMKEMMTPKPFGESTFYLYLMDADPKMEPLVVKTNKKGEATMVIPPGHYTIMLFPRTELEERIMAKEFEGIDQSCLREHFMQGVHDIPIPEGMTDIEIPVLIRCNPCMPPKP